jgi:tRNA (mo5U34)-methyltransferase
VSSCGACRCTTIAQTDERWDLVLFMGVFYHLRYPMLGLDIVAERVRRLLVFQTLTMPGDEVSEDTRADHDLMDRESFADPGWPKMAFIEHSFVGDPTNWWAPNHAAVEAMLRSSGMRISSRPGHEMYVCEAATRRAGISRGIGSGCGTGRRSRGAACSCAATTGSATRSSSSATRRCSRRSRPR